MSRKAQKPDVDRVLGGLKDFQRDTVEYVFRRMYTDEEPTGRFLVADEVGLGKTLVARGVIARAIDHLWDRVDRIDVVYICSNAEIARQKIAQYYAPISWHCLLAGYGIFPEDRLIRPAQKAALKYDMAVIDDFIARCALNFRDHKELLAELA